jgi:hypothetical protein
MAGLFKRCQQARPYRHRVSVALALGHRDIAAWVTETGSLASTTFAAAA